MSSTNACTEKIIGCAFEVHRYLGCGFLEKVYENALVMELRDKGFDVKQQYPITVIYKGKIVGEYVVDLIVDNKVLVELKTAREIASAHIGQCLHYLKAMRLPIGLLLNFGTERLGIKRVTIQRLLSAD